jgi:hypothetical protein
VVAAVSLDTGPAVIRGKGVRVTPASSAPAHIRTYEGGSVVTLVVVPAMAASAALVWLVQGIAGWLT